MGFLENLFKPAAQPEAEVQRSVKVLGDLKPRRQAETGQWLRAMRTPGPPPTIEDVDQLEVVNDQPYMPALETQYKDLAPPKVALNQQDAQGNETAGWVNALFTQFQRQVEAYNRNPASSQLVMSLKMPEFSFETPQYSETYDPNKKLSVIKGHVTMGHWALLVQGCETQIDAFIISASEVLNFTINDIRQASVNPFLSITSALVDSHRVWSISGSTIDDADIPLLAKELVGDLIRVSTGVMSEDELFLDHKVDFKIGENVAKGFAVHADGNAGANSIESAQASSATQADTQSSVVAADLSSIAAARELVAALRQDLANFSGSSANVTRISELATLKTQVEEFLRITSN